MSVDVAKLENQAFTLEFARDVWETWEKGSAYRFHVLITKDENNVFSAVALNLPGVGSCGDTAEEAIEGLKEAARGVLESYAASNLEIPWRDSSDATDSYGKEKWIIVNA